MGNWADRPVRLLGRSDALAAAESGLARGGGVMVVGAPGVGKTALVQAVADDLSTEAGTRVLRFQAQRSAPEIPFGVFAQVAAIASPPSDEPVDRFLLLQSVRRALTDAAGSDRLVLVVDDAQFLDESSAMLITQLVSEGNARAALASRSGDPMPPPLVSLWKDGAVARIDLKPLERADSIALAELLLGGPADSDLAEVLWHLSEGNPAYLRELILAGVDSGRIAEQRGVWRLYGQLVISPRLEELLSERLRFLDEATRQSLEIVAIADPLPLKIATEVIAEAHLEVLQERDLVQIERSEEGVQVRIGHPVYVELLRQRTPSSRSTRLKALLADAFDMASPLPGDLMRVATWRLDSGTPCDPDLLQTAAAMASARLDWHLAVRLAKAALAAGGGTPSRISVAEALGHLGRARDALTVLAGVTGDDDAQQAQLSVLRASIMFWGLGDWSGANRVLEDAEQNITDPSERTWVGSTRAGLLNFIGRPDVAASASRPLLDAPHLSVKARLAAGHGLATALAWGGSCDQALRVLDALRPDGRGAPGETAVNTGWSLVVRTSAHRVAGRVQHAEDAARAEYATGMQTHNRQLKYVALGALAWVALVRGQLALAVLRYREAISEATSSSITELSMSRRHLMCDLVEALAVSGDAVEAAAVLSDARADVPISERWLAPRLWIARAWVSVARGETSNALNELNTAVSEARKGGQLADELVALLTRLRLGIIAGTGAGEAIVNRIDDLALQVEGELVNAMALHSHALAEGSPDSLDAVAERYAVLGLWLYAAETAAQASQLHARAGQPRRAAASASRAQSMLPGLESSRPLTVLFASTPASLTRREREVALLARSGMSSQAIAARLHLSPRTVDTHLARVYFKLGISRRSELAEAMGIATG